MKIFLEETINEYTYNIEVESIIYNRDKLDEDLVEIALENFGNNLCKQFENNSKFIRDQLEIDTFDVWVAGIDNPSVILSFSSDNVIDEDTLKNVLGRYTTKPYTEDFDGSVIDIKPVRGEMKVYLSR